MAAAGTYTSTEWRSAPEYARLSSFAKAVYELCAAIPAGKVATYGVLSEALAGDSKHARAVGTALHHNPFAPAVPCHRVIRQGGSIGGFAGSVQESNSSDIRRKRDLLGGEGVHFSAAANAVTSPSDGAVSAATVMTAAEFDPAAVTRARALYHAPPVTAGKRRRSLDADDSDLSKLKALAYSASRSPRDALRDRLSAAGTTGRDVRAAVRSGTLTGHTSGVAPGYAQANMVILPREHAMDFLLFASRNPKPCPVLEVCEAGVYTPRVTAVDADVRRDAPAYVVWRGGVQAEVVNDIRHLWPDAGAAGPDARVDWVTFIIGCSFSFEQALLDAGLPVRHLQQEKSADAPVPRGGMATHPRNVPMYRTNVATHAAGPFRGPLVVSMRPMTPAQPALPTPSRRSTHECMDVCACRPVFAGDPAMLGITDINKPDYGDPVCILPGEVPVFWACGVTPQAALAEARIPIAITHAPGHMLVLDVTNKELAGVPEVQLSSAAAAVSVLREDPKRRAVVPSHRGSAAARR